MQRILQVVSVGQCDLEHKEVWQSFVILAFILLLIVFYVFVSEGPLSQYAMQVIGIVLVGYLLWRVETLSDLSMPLLQSLPDEDKVTEDIEDHALSTTIYNNIGPLLQKHCIDTQLYLQHDLTVFQLAQTIGINRLYVSQYFSRQGMSYNAYINDLRINHFMRLYREATEAGQSITAQHLASDSGYRSYSTFGLAFKQRMGKSVTAWMRNPAK